VEIWRIVRARRRRSVAIITTGMMTFHHFLIRVEQPVKDMSMEYETKLQQPPMIVEVAQNCTSTLKGASSIGRRPAHKGPRPRGGRQRAASTSRGRTSPYCRHGGSNITQYVLPELRAPSARDLWSGGSFDAARLSRAVRLDVNIAHRVREILACALHLSEQPS
jgi:hypothetical protein